MITVHLINGKNLDLQPDQNLERINDFYYIRDRSNNTCYYKIPISSILYIKYGD